MASGMPLGTPMTGAPPQVPPSDGMGGGSPLSQLAQKPSTPDSGGPLLQMIMAMLAGAGLEGVSKSITSLMKLGQPSKATGMQHAKQPGAAPPGMQPSKGAAPAGPPGQAAPVGAPGAMGQLPPQLIQRLLAMLQGGQGGQGGLPPQ